jgi:O-antigen ligase
MLMPLGRIENFKASLLESLAIIKTCLTTIWFWIPVLLAAYMWVQLGMMFYISPLAALIVPSILIVYALIQENRRTRALYGLDGMQSEDSGKRLLAEVDIRRLVSEYNVMLKNKKESEDNEN